jgi:type II secretory pathway pseudopilin PulG
MKTKGFTLVELVVACTLLIMLSTIATTSTYNFVQATANLKAQNISIQNIMALHGVLVQAKMNYATDLALVASAANAASDTTKAQGVEAEIQLWNGWAAQNESPLLIGRLITPGLTGLPLVNPGGSYLPTSRMVQVTTSINGKVQTNSVVVQITDLDSLLRAYELTDDGTPTGNIVATIGIGSMLDVSSAPPTRPTLPIIDFKSGTPQWIRF